MLRRSPLLALILVAGVAAAARAQSGRALSIEDYYRIRTVGSPALSADARLVAFTVTTRVEENNGSTSEVWIVPADGSAPAKKLGGVGNATNPQWMDDGRLRVTSGGKTLIVNPQSPDRADTAITQAGGPVTPSGRGGGRGNGASAPRPLPSPDGKWIAVIRDFPVPKPAAANETEFEKRAESHFKGVQFDWMDFHRDGQPFPLPNRRDIQANPPQEIVIRSPAGGERQLTTLRLRPTGVQWSKDASTVLFTADSLYRDERSYGRDEIWTVSVEGKLTRITPSTDYEYRGATYSPDGRWIMATRSYATDMVISRHLDHGGPVDIIVIPASGGKEVNLTSEWDYIPAAPRFSPDGRYIYFTGGVGGTNHVFRVSPEGGPVEQVTTGQRRIGDIVIDRNFTKLVYTVGVNESPAELYSADIDGKNERQLTDVEDSFTKEISFSKSDRLAFKSADGTPVEGWLTFPYGYKANGGPYPLVVSNHGGPHSAIQYGFNFKNQYLAANGYFVLEVNFRSSTGYGEKFLWGTWGAWGTRDGQDVMAGIDYVLSKYPIDRKRVATIGHSYGGFMTNWLITQYPDRFAAAIPGAGIVNWMSDYGNADIPNTKEREFFGSPWDERARDIMIRQSPLTYADRAKAPTLFINGEIDQRVPFSEAEQMYVALKKNGVPAKMIRYDGMPHAISGNWNVVHRMIVERRWLDQWMK